jgi:hypothetical protein
MFCNVVSTAGSDVDRAPPLTDLNRWSTVFRTHTLKRCIVLLQAIARHTNVIHNISAGLHLST